MIIDAMWGWLPTPDAWATNEASLARMVGYLERFGDEWPPPGVDDPLERIAVAAERGRARCPSESEFVERLRASEVGRTALAVERLERSLGIPGPGNDELAAFVAAHDDLVFGIGSVDPWDEGAPAEVHRLVRELGLRAVVLSVFKHRLRASDARLGPIYAACQEEGVPIMLSTGINLWKEVPYDLGHPRDIDLVASAFPKLKIVCMHSGWPWVKDTVMVAWRHEHVYLETSAHRPKHFTVPEAGWGPLLHYGNRMLADRLIFGSTGALLGAPVDDLVAEVRALPLKDEVIEAWLGGNAARLFGFD